MGWEGPRQGPGAVRKKGDGVFRKQPLALGAVGGPGLGLTQLGSGSAWAGGLALLGRGVAGVDGIARGFRLVMGCGVIKLTSRLACRGLETSKGVC